jgi:moderate conductance mechanosensitive channel
MASERGSPTFVNLGCNTAVVEGRSNRAVALRDCDGSVHTIAHGSIDVVTSMTEDFSRWVFNIGVAWRENIHEIIRTARGSHKQIRKACGLARPVSG